ncbi:MAG: (E)-4-hydroxy-3-methylbut-2-enyl-diphosphate synthase [Bacteroidales bacterium]|jgi:(E)-4-hydroxy-3-methylbut-2-enyl-diphosphate synthase|nr:(E)-4-hydroxy-3-methylbut-2-enyl-diphosphate synthase [Bacteroidales bacterium]MDD3151776.1 (E)-4-hydroxy-3-methylbut-2-enyl-diphosphate synthase [Bacteroidales bacterium]MDD3914082.1 (E)-4-hydroxy-3-methylbut-2-enyl-diphosphate synthase [Bacteroidales bacterium]MDD4634016.1 (E)-4-hydroxy-3-methylbut-2-enyl-diphosphate synthase [Bacteroidales bacterium]
MSTVVKIGDLLVGGNNPVRVQSMTNTPTDDVEKTVRQVVELVDAGCELVRITARNSKDVDCLEKIKNNLAKLGCHVPLIADVHFNPKVAELAAAVVDKVRINPGNYIDKKTDKQIFTEQDTKDAIEAAKINIAPLIEICRQNGTAIRIGSNHGSLSDRIIYKYGDTADGMVASVMEFLSIFEYLDFHNIVVSLKSSNPIVMMEANHLLIKQMQTNGMDYPIHLGVTEAGAGQDAVIKSAVGIGCLLNKGIGDTIRVSLSENPVNEIAPAIEIAKFKSYCEHNVTKNITCLPNNSSMLVKTNSISEFSDEAVNIVDFTDKNLREMCCYLDDYYSNHKDKIAIKKFYDLSLNSEKLAIQSAVEFGTVITRHHVFGIETNLETSLVFDILQACKVRLTKAEYISCPTCGRTAYDLFSVLEEVKQKTSHLKNVTIAVMGCIVNGPGEMRGADYGVVGAGKNKVVIYAHGKQVTGNFDASVAADELLKIIKGEVVRD